VNRDSWGFKILAGFKAESDFDHFGNTPVEADIGSCLCYPPLWTMTTDLKQRMGIACHAHKVFPIKYEVGSDTGIGY